MHMMNYASKINDIWNGLSDDLTCVWEAMKQLDSGLIRVAEKNQEGKWIVNDYLKKAILLFFKHNKSSLIHGNCCNFFDKVPLKTKTWDEEQFLSSGFRLVPGSVIRYSAFIAKSAVIMPSFINVGAYIDEFSMIDSNATVGSCAQIGKNCHISDGVTIGGVLEPLQANPVIIEDNCFIGVKSAVTEGIIIEEGAVLGAGVILTGSTKIIDRETGNISYGRVPSYCVVVPGSYRKNADDCSALSCAVIIKRVTKETREKTSINDLLR